VGKAAVGTLALAPLEIPADVPPATVAAGRGHGARVHVVGELTVAELTATVQEIPADLGGAAATIAAAAPIAATAPITSFTSPRGTSTPQVAIAGQRTRAATVVAGAPAKAASPRGTSAPQVAIAGQRTGAAEVAALVGAWAPAKVASSVAPPAAEVAPPAIRVEI